jgi:replicative DNA helicase
MNQIVDEATENVVLGSLILNPKEYDAVTPYIPDLKVFSQKKARTLWLKVGKMVKSGAKIDTLTVCNSITGDDRGNGLTKGYVVDCTSDACALGMTEVYAQTIYEKYLLRKIVTEAEGIKNNVVNHGHDVYELITNTHTLMGELIRVRPGEQFNIDSTIQNTISTMENSSNRMIKTGYKEIDGLAGGLTRGEITIVGGRPGHGKTTFLVNLLSSLIKGGYKVAMFNRELPNTEVIKKLICIENPKLLYRNVRKGIVNKDDKKFIEELQKASKSIINKYSEDKFIMFDNIRDLPKTASEVKKFKPDVIIDDYIQLVNPVGKEDTRRLQLERICNDYKWLAKENDCSVILASQLNRYIEARSREAKRPQLSDLAECGAIEQVAENVFFVYYPYKVDPAMHSPTEIKLVASKVRYGVSNEIDLSYMGDICTIYDNWSLKNFKEPNEEQKIPFT